ncbi:gluconolactonase-like [Glandiceps talaboti]
MTAMFSMTSLLTLFLYATIGSGEKNFIAYSEDFIYIIGNDPELELLAKSNQLLEFHEGPVYFPNDDEGYLLYTTQPVGDYDKPNSKPLNCIRQYDIKSGKVTTFRQTSIANMPNGQFRDSLGRLLTCEQGFKDRKSAGISRTNLTSGEVEVLTDNYYGMSLNSPNDIVVKSDGTVWFTDPSYGFMQSFRPKPEVGDFVYRLDTTEHDDADRMTVVTDSHNKPNGLAFSPDERYLYITDSGAIQTPGSWHPDFPHHVVRYDIVDGKRLRNRELFAVVGNSVKEGGSPGIPDGIKVDQCGNIYIGAGDGVQVFNSDGDLIGKIMTPTFVSNLEFGGKQGNDLFLMANPSLFKVTLNAYGTGFSPRQSCRHVQASNQSRNI